MIPFILGHTPTGTGLEWMVPAGWTQVLNCGSFNQNLIRLHADTCGSKISVYEAAGLHSNPFDPGTRAWLVPGSTTQLEVIYWKEIHEIENIGEVSLDPKVHGDSTESAAIAAGVTVVNSDPATVTGVVLTMEGVWSSGTAIVKVSDKSVPVIEDEDTPDWLIIRYVWSAGGNDLDTRTQMLAPRTGSEMGWSRSSSDAPYGNFSGDNTANDGMESCYFDLAKIREDYPNADEVSIVSKGFWFADRHTGDVTIELELAKGGTISQTGYNFNVSGATSTAGTFEERNVTMQGSSDLDGEMIFLITVSLKHGWVNKIHVARENETSGQQFGDNIVHGSNQAAVDAFNEDPEVLRTLTYASSYTFYIIDDSLSDNLGTIQLNLGRILDYEIQDRWVRTKTDNPLDNFFPRYRGLETPIDPFREWDI